MNEDNKLEFDRSDGWKCLTFVIALLAGLFTIWNWNIENLIIHIKAIYTTLLILAAFIGLYLIIFKTKSKTNGKKKRL